MHVFRMNGVHPHQVSLIESLPIEGHLGWKPDHLRSPTNSILVQKLLVRLLASRYMGGQKYGHHFQHELLLERLQLQDLERLQLRDFATPRSFLLEGLQVRYSTP